MFGGYLWYLRGLASPFPLVLILISLIPTFIVETE